jgi:hypothetical protein
MDAGKWCKETVVTARVSRVELRERCLQQLPQKCYRPRGHPLLQRFGRHRDRLSELGGFGC